MKIGDAASYDEFSMLKIYADIEGIPWQGQPKVERLEFALKDGSTVSALHWGSRPAEAVLIHGMGQNAHTWDSVALALDSPLLAIDLPGHGHSDWREDHDYSPHKNAQAVTEVLRSLAPPVRAVIGASLGGLTAICTAALAPSAVERLMVIDITPGSGERGEPDDEQNRSVARLLQANPVFDSFEAMLDAAAASRPGRPRDSLRPGVRHNSRQLADGRWTWRYDPDHGQGPGVLRERDRMWRDLASLRVPLAFVRGTTSQVVRDEDERQLVQLQPDVQIYRVERAGHFVQSDRPVELARIIAEFAASPIG
jgi:pimeloyl-ACP methyl ester carboxylesterase